MSNALRSIMKSMMRWTTRGTKTIMINNDDNDGKQY